MKPSELNEQMSSPESFNKTEIEAGRLTMNHITKLAIEFQKAHGLAVDGKAGKNTRAELDKLTPSPATTSTESTQFGGSMSGAESFNKAEFEAGRLTMPHITKLALEFQKAHGLAFDGKAGKNTRAELDKLTPSPVVTPTKTFSLNWPMPTLADGRKPEITSGFGPRGGKQHDGVDLFYKWVKGDEPDKRGDKLAAGELPNGDPKWVVPYETPAVAAADGVVQIAGNISTGYRCWIDHGNGMRTGYFHLLNLDVAKGDSVVTGTPLGLVGDNPADKDARHLHFEVSPVNKYAPVDPAPYLPH
jgi:murein DD-endopeptidase MepM/ murein hydrolase activator NlpD